MLIRIIFSILWGALVFGVYWALSETVIWSLQEHPFVVLTVIAVGGVPVGYFVTRYANRESQKRSIWSTLRDVSRGKGISIPEPRIEDRVLGAANIDGIPFRMVSIHVTPEGVRLDRPFVSVRPISIPWQEIQRVDNFSVPQKKKQPLPGALIQLRNSDREIIVFPWDESNTEQIPENVGTTELYVSTQ
ncbi:MAG: hypothetical protein QNJ19_15040 [Woeseiaceae bacterium]|nr:hypothetical protein [Woeseiaceae bacterium]